MIQVSFKKVAQPQDLCTQCPKRREIFRVFAGVNAESDLLGRDLTPIQNSISDFLVCVCACVCVCVCAEGEDCAH